jgi:hypothetical protein
METTAAKLTAPYHILNGLSRFQTLQTGLQEGFVLLGYHVLGLNDVGIVLDADEFLTQQGNQVPGLYCRVQRLQGPGPFL